MIEKTIPARDFFGLVRDRTPACPAEKVPPGTYLQYMGFGQLGSIRQYRFRRISRGEKTREYLVDADMALFAKHHVGIQEGPTLSLHLLLSDRSSGAPVGATPSSLTDFDMLAHVANRPSRQTNWERNKLLKKEI